MRLKRIVPAVLVLALLVVAGWYAFGRDGGEADRLTASGTVEATEADLGFQAGGRIAELGAVEGEAVVAGQVLARLDAAELSARRSAVQGQLDAARALLSELQRGARPEELQQVRAAERAAQERLEDAARLLERTRVLEAEGAVSRQTLDQARTAHEVARAQLEQARGQSELVQRGPRSERVDAQRAAVRQAEAAVAQADAALANAVITAPFAGVVTVRHRQPGEAVQPGAPVLTVMDPSDRWVRIHVREDAIGGVSLGDEVEIRTDSDPDRVIVGRVSFIASEAEFTPRNIQTEAERVKLVYAVKVVITGDPEQLLKPGVPADVTWRTVHD